MSAIKLDGYSNFGFFQTLRPQLTAAASIEGDAVDVRDFQTATLVVNVGGCASGGAMGATQRGQLMLEHGNSNATTGAVTWSEVYASQMIHSVTGANGVYSTLNSGIFQSLASYTDASAMYYVGYRGPKRWLRARFSQVAAASAFSISAMIVCGLPNNWPVNDPANS